jgi:hypothetical protein
MLACRAAFAEIGSVASPLLLQQSRPLNAEYLVDAATTSFVASIGIAAAVVRRHWFLRFAAVGGVLALGLLVPAYEIVIEFAIQVAVISAGVALWRGASIRRPRMSLETALLAMVVAAVMAAVVGAAPTFGWDTWARIVFLGLTLGVMSLLSLWIACGRASLPIRLFGGALGVVVFIAIFHFGIALRDAYYSSQRGIDWWSYLVNCYRPHFLAGWLLQVAPSIALGVITFTSLLMLARASGWFTEGDSTDDQARFGRLVKTISRVCLCAGFGVIAAGNVYLLYRLCTPPDHLSVNIPSDNGYDDIVAAGKMVDARLQASTRQDWSTYSDFDLARLVNDLKPAFARLNAGLQKPCVVVRRGSDSPLRAEEPRAVLDAASLFDLRYECLRRLNTSAEIAELSLQELRFAFESSRGQQLNHSLEGYITGLVADRLYAALGALSASKCKEFAKRLTEIERLREPVEAKLERETIDTKRQSWQAHMTALVNEWNGTSIAASHEGYLRNGRCAEAQMRLLVVQAALQAYWLDHRRLPERLDELVPEYLPAVPDDPMGDGPLKYARDRGVYRAYSVWHDGQDNGGVTWLNGSVADLVVIGPHLPPLPYRWKRTAAEYVGHAWATLKAASDAAAALQELRAPAMRSDSAKSAPAATAPH